jgi:hypothetical protein
LDDHNYALDALRYLIRKIDAHRRMRPTDVAVVAEPSAAPPPKRDRYASGWPDPDDESLWTPIGGWGR